MTNWEIALALTIVGLSIVMPIYYSYQKKIEKQKIEQALKHGREVAAVSYTHLTLPTN